MPNTRERLSDLEDHLRDCLARYQDFDNKITPSEYLEKSLSKFYKIVIGFCVEATSVLDLRVSGIIRVLLTKKLSGPFDTFLTDLVKISESIDRGVNQQTLGGVQSKELRRILDIYTNQPQESKSYSM